MQFFISTCIIELFCTKQWNVRGNETEDEFDDYDVYHRGRKVDDWTDVISV